MIEDMEIDLRSHMDYLYIQKTKEVMEMIRCDTLAHPKPVLFVKKGSGTNRCGLPPIFAAARAKSDENKKNHSMLENQSESSRRTQDCDSSSRHPANFATASAARTKMNE